MLSQREPPVLASKRPRPSALLRRPKTEVTVKLRCETLRSFSSEGRKSIRPSAGRSCLLSRAPFSRARAEVVKEKAQHGLRRSCSPAGRKKKTSPLFFSPECSAETSTLVQEKRGTGAVTEARVAPLLCLSARWTASLLFPAVCRRRRSTRRCPYLRPYLFFLTGGEKNAHLPSRISFIFVVKTPDAGLDATAAWW